MATEPVQLAFFAHFSPQYFPPNKTGLSLNIPIPKGKNHQKHPENYIFNENLLNKKVC
jgi:hypothetical protein